MLANTGRWEQEMFKNSGEESDMKRLCAKADRLAKRVPRNTSRWHMIMSHTFGIF